MPMVEGGGLENGSPLRVVPQHHVPNRFPTATRPLGRIHATPPPPPFTHMPRQQWTQFRHNGSALGHPVAPPNRGPFLVLTHTHCSVEARERSPNLSSCPQIPMGTVSVRVARGCGPAVASSFMV